MIKVRLVKGFSTIGAAALTLPTLVGCSQNVEPSQTDDVGTGSQNNTESIAGTGVITLHGWRLYYGSTSGGDEFLRVGEKLKVAIDHLTTVQMVAGADQALQQDLRANPDHLKIMLRVQYTKADGTTFDAPEVPVTWGPGSSNLIVGSSGEIMIPAGVRRMKIELGAEFSRAGVPQHMDVLAQNSVQREMVVYGAYLPNKLALFDTMGAERRTRLLEGGAVLKNSTVTLSVTDWRLDTIVDKTTLDLRVGDRESGSRFGPVIVPAMGELEYEVAAVVSTDGGATYQPASFTKVAKPDVLAGTDGFRFTYEAQAQVSGNAGPSMKVAFHVRAFLKVPDGGIMNGRYAPGSRVLLKDTWDNNGGGDYALPIQ